jgi:hypothetical protein
VAESFVTFPTRHLLGNRVEVSDPVFQVRADYGIANGIQRRPRTILLFIEHRSEFVALDDGVQRLAESPVIVVTLQEIVVRTLSQGYSGDPLVLGIRQNHQGNLRRCAVQPGERVETGAVRQVQIRQHRRNIRAYAITESRQGIPTTSDPVNIEPTVAAPQQCITDQLGVGRIRDQQYVMRNVLPLASVNL